MTPDDLLLNDFDLTCPVFAHRAYCSLLAGDESWQQCWQGYSWRLRLAVICGHWTAFAYGGRFFRNWYHYEIKRAIRQWRAKYKDELG